MPAILSATDLSSTSQIASQLAACTAAALLSLFATSLLARHGARLGLQDLPNARSSHQRPTPRGGGIAILAAFLVALPWALPGGAAPAAPLAASLAAAVLLALVGLADDRFGLGLAVRLAAQSLAMLALLLAVAHVAIPGTPADSALPVAVTGIPSLARWLPSAWPAWAVTGMDIAFLPLLLLGGVWWVNLFNFMDGIDGLAASQALFMLLAALLIKLLGSGEATDAAQVLAGPAAAASLVLAAAVAGFLVLNWAPARIFLGDAGSLFLGFSIVAIAAHDFTGGDMSLWTWLILGNLFLVDATVTLLRRWIGGDPVTAAHRSHLYQRLGRRWGGHAKVSLVYCLLNVSWNFPLALSAHQAPHWAPVILLLALLPPAAVAWRMGAGLRDG